MNELKNRINRLVSLTDKFEIIKALQSLEEYVLRNYQMRIFGHIVQMTEIEIYYRNELVGFVDSTMHGHPRQTANFNNLYLHGAGIDICLSDSTDYMLSILIRGGKVDDAEYKRRPLLLYDAVVPKKPDLDAQPPVLERLANPNTSEPVLYAVRYGVRNMTENNGELVKQEDKDLVLRAHLGEVDSISCKLLPGKTSFHTI